MKYPEGFDTKYDAARVELGAAVRRLGHAVIAREADLELMATSTRIVTEISESLEDNLVRSRDSSQFRISHDDEVLDNTVLSSHITRPGSGPGSPHGLEMQVHRRGDRVEATFMIGPSFEGAPQRSHGGIVALAFDDAMGFMLNIIKIVAFTGELTIRYETGTPLLTPLVIQSWLDRREGRKLFLQAELRVNNGDPDNTPTLATASAVFIAIE